MTDHQTTPPATDEEIREAFAHRELSDEEVRAVKDLLAVVARGAVAAPRSSGGAEPQEGTTDEVRLLRDTAILLRDIVTQDGGYSAGTREETMRHAGELDALAARLSERAAPGAAADPTREEVPHLTMLDIRTFASLYHSYSANDGTTTRATLNESYARCEDRLAALRATVDAAGAREAALREAGTVLDNCVTNLARHPGLLSAETRDALWTASEAWLAALSPAAPSGSTESPDA